MPIGVGQVGVTVGVKASPGFKGPHQGIPWRSPPLSAKGPSLLGISRDGAGAALGNCVVKIIQTSTNTLVAQTTSDSLGSWVVSVFGVTGPFYTVEYLAGSPDAFGTSANTLMPV